MSQRSRRSRLLPAILFVGCVFLVSEWAGLGRRTLRLSSRDSKFFRVELSRNENLFRMIEFVDGVSSHQLELARGEYRVRIRLSGNLIRQTQVDLNEDFHLRIDEIEGEVGDRD